MSLFKTAKSLLFPPQPSTNEVGITIPYGLTASELFSLKRLLSEDGWPAFEKALDEEAKLKGDQILLTSDEKALHFMRGFVMGLRKASNLIQEIKLREQHLEREQQRQRTRQRDTGVLFGTPGWRNHT